jgi:hypothetical protein
MRPRANSLCIHAAAAGYLAARPPTLEIFPTWPMRHQQQLHSVSEGAARFLPMIIHDSSPRSRLLLGWLVALNPSVPRSAGRPRPPVNLGYDAWLKYFYRSLTVVLPGLRNC